MPRGPAWTMAGVRPWRAPVPRLAGCFQGFVAVRYSPGPVLQRAFHGILSRCPGNARTAPSRGLCGLPPRAQQPGRVCGPDFLTPLLHLHRCFPRLALSQRGPCALERERPPGGAGEQRPFLAGPQPNLWCWLCIIFPNSGGETPRGKLSRMAALCPTLTSRAPCRPSCRCPWPSSRSVPMPPPRFWLLASPSPSLGFQKKGLPRTRLWLCSTHQELPLMAALSPVQMDSRHERVRLPRGKEEGREGRGSASVCGRDP